MNLTTTNELIRVTTSSAADLDVLANWVDKTTTLFTPGCTRTKITSATTTTITAAPAASTQRAITSMRLFNVHASTTQIVTIEHFDGSTALRVFQATLLAGESLGYDGEHRWQRFNSAGAPVSIVQGSAAGYLIMGGTLNVAILTDSANLYFGARWGNGTATAAAQKMRILRPGVVVAAVIHGRVGTAGGADAWSGYLQRYNSSDSLLSSDLISSPAVAANEREWINYSMSVSVNQGDSLEFKLVNPAWASNPANLHAGGYVFVQTG